MTASVEQATRLYLLAKEASAEAEKAKKEAETELRKALATAGITESVVDGVQVSITTGTRRAYDADKLAMLVKPAIYKKVTKTVIDADLLEKAVGIIIEQSVADEVTTVTTYTQVRTYAISPEAKAKSKSTDKTQVA
jgi:hypothetical protein